MSVLETKYERFRTVASFLPNYECFGMNYEQFGNKLR